MSDLRSDFMDESDMIKAVEGEAIDPLTLERFAFKSNKVKRIVALHPKASPELLARLAESPDRLTRRNVVLNPQTPKEVLLQLAPTFAGEFFQNPSFDLLLVEDPNLLFSLPVGVMKNILKRTDCPDSFVNWAAKFGNRSHQLAVVGRPDLTRENLNAIAEGKNVQPAEIAAGRLMAGDYKD